MAKRKYQETQSVQSSVAAKKEENTVTVKSALKKRYRIQELFDRIQDDVLELSALAVEASIFIHFDLSRKFLRREFPTAKINFYQYFRALQQRNARHLDDDYRALRGNLPFYDGDNRSNIIQHLVNGYETCFKNNLKTHAWNRLRSFFHKFNMIDANGEQTPFNETEIYNTLEYLFYREPTRMPNQLLLEAMRTHLAWDGRRLFDIDSAQYFRHVQLFYDLQRFNEDHGHENFKLIPQHHFGAMHIRYDTQGIFYTLTYLGLIKPAEHIPDEVKRHNPNWNRHYWQNEGQAEMWLRFFKPPETCNKKFDWTIQTDGVAVSFKMKKLNGTVNIPETERLEIIRQKMNNNEYSAELGLDPGYKLMVGGIIRERSNDMWLVRDIKISSDSYHNKSGFTRRYLQLREWTTPERTEESSKAELYETYTAHKLGIFATKQQEFSQRKVVRLKLQKYICVRKTCAALAKQITNGKKNVLIAIGSTKVAANSPIRGYRRTPNRALLRELKEVADVVEEDEFRTTMLCSSCRFVNITSRSPHRYQFCPNCHTHWHRDVNAGINILYKAKCRINQIPLHPHFERTWAFN